MSDALREVDFNIAEASKLPKGHFFKAAYELPNKQGTVRFTSKGRSMTAPTTLWVKGPKDKEYEEYKEYKNMRAAKKEYDGMKSAAQQEELDLFEDGEEGENKVTLKRKNKKGEIKVVPVERGERKAGEDEEDYEDRNPGGEKGWKSRRHLRHQKKDKEDQDKDPVGKQHEAAEWDVDDKKEKGEHADKTEAEIKKEIEKLKGKKGNEEEMASLKLALRAKGGWEKGEGATEEVEVDETLPDHLAKFLDKKGNPNKEAQARIDAGRKKRAAAAAEPKITDVTPKGYGPKEEVEVDEAKFKHPDAGVPLSVRRARKKKSAAQMKKDMNHADMLSKTNTGKAPVDYHRESEETIKEVSPPGWEGTIKAMKKDKDITNPWALGWWMKNRGYKSHKEEVEIDELSTDLLGRYKKRAAAQSSAASKAGYHKLAHKRYKGVNTATTLQFRNDAKKYDERQKKKKKDDNIAYDTARHAAKTKYMKGAQNSEYVPQGNEVELDEKDKPETVRQAAVRARRVRAADDFHHGDHTKMPKFNPPKKGREAIKDEVEVDEGIGRLKDASKNLRKAYKRLGITPNKTTTDPKTGVRTTTYKGKIKWPRPGGQMGEGTEGDVDAFDYKAKKGAIAAPGSGSIAKPRKPKASDVNKSIEQQMADARKEEVTMEDMKWKVSLTGLPQFYMDGKSAAEVKLTLRKMLKRPDDILDIERTQLAKVRKDFRMRGQGKTEPENNSE